VPRPAVLVACAAAVTVLLVGGGVVALGGEDEPAEPEGSTSAAPFETTPLSAYDTSGVAVTRGPFCDRIDERQVTATLGGDAADSSSWQNGDTIDVGGGVEDVAHEFGCRYVAADGTVAQAWVFAPPVDAATAQQMVTTAGKAASCRVGTGPAFGAPTLALTCLAKDGSTRASYRGLFGDAWLVCEVDQPSGVTTDAADRAGRWCVGVLEATRTQAP